MLYIIFWNHMIALFEAETEILLKIFNCMKKSSSYILLDDSFTGFNNKGEEMTEFSFSSELFLLYRCSTFAF